MASMHGYMVCVYMRGGGGVGDGKSLFNGAVITRYVCMDMARARRREGERERERVCVWWAA